MKTNRHSLMAKGILVLLSLLVLIFAFTFSWFTIAEPDSQANGLIIKAHSSADFEYAIGFKTEQTYNNYYHTAFTNQTDGELNLKELYAVDENGNRIQDAEHHDMQFDLLYDYTPIDVTGDGVTLVRPAMDYGNWKVNSASRNYSIAKPNSQYISFDLIVRAKGPTTLSLDTTSYAKGACESYAGDYSNLVGSSVTRKSTYGNFSRDALVGALRVAFIGYNNSGDPDFDKDALLNEEQTVYNSTPELLWVPRPDIYLNNDPDNNPNNGDSRELETSGWSLATGITPSTKFNLKSTSRDKSDYSTYVHEYYNIAEVGENETPSYVLDNASTTKISSFDGDNHVTFGQSSQILEVNVLDDTDNDGVHDDDEYYYGKVRVRLWLEGADTESRRALAGGQFSVNFDLTTH